MTVKRVVSHEAKTPVISIIFFTLLIFFMFADSIISNASLHSVAFNGKQDSDHHQSLQSPKFIRKITKNVAVDVVLPSNNRRKLPEFEMLTSDDLTKKFHGRVLEFFNRDCEAQFFMTWISPAESFGRREFLAVESVFKAHPQACLMILSRTMDSVNGYRTLKPLLDRGFKLAAVTPDLPFLLSNTPAEAWLNDIKSGKKHPGQIPIAQNLSNLIRLAVLYKYGGIYVDTDFIVLNSFRSLKNTIGAQSIDAVSKNWTRLNNAVLVFDMNHPLLFKFMEEFALTFDGNKWGHNGPYMVSRVVHRVEGREGFENITILPPMAFYPVDWIKIGSLFKLPKARVDLKWVEAKVSQLKRESYGVHLWNKQSSKLGVEEGSVMGRLISEHCVLCEHIYSS